MVDPYVTHSTLAHPPRAKRLGSLLILLFLGIVWGLSFSLARMATESGIHPVMINYWSCLIGASLLSPYCLFTKQIPPITRSLVGFYLICALLGSVIPGTLYFYAAAHVSAGVLSITIATVPLLTFIAAAIFRIEKLSYKRILGILCGISSISLLVLPESSLPDPKAAPWVIMMVLAAACYAAEGLVIATRAPPRVNVFVVVTAMLITAVIVMTPIVWLTGTFEVMPWPFSRSSWAILGMSVIMATAYGAFYYLIVLAGPVYASQTAYLITLSGVLWGILIYDETHSAWIWVSLAVMMIALTLVKPQEATHQGQRYQNKDKIPVTLPGTNGES
ncbi:MAG TPA: DMT family transporter [Gammaproteobacteria bacterium]|nr:DMT family transporter [Gammaproteobacteria bacterium]